MEQIEIMPFHQFNYRGNNYAIDVESMQARVVDETTTQALQVIVNEPTKAINEAFPINTMALFLTHSCNLKCIYCFEDEGETRLSGNMEEHTALQAVDWLIEKSQKLKKIHIYFFGGEPLINFPLMKTVVEYAQQRVNLVDKRVAFSITTNATLLSDEVIALFKKHNFNVMISIDGPKEIQDRQRPLAGGQGSFDVILPRIKKLLAVIPEARGHAVLSEDSNPQMVIDALKEIGFSRVSTGPVSKSSFGEESCSSAKLEKDLSQLFDMMEREAEAWVKHTKNRDSEALMDLISTGCLYEGITRLLNNSKKRYPCKAGLDFVGISCDGAIYPCQRFVGLDKYQLGSIFSNHNLDRKIYHQPPTTYIEECAGCFARYYCAGGCPFMNTVSNGSMSTKNPCQVRRRELELSAYICCMLEPEDQDFLIEHKIFPPKPCPLDF